jgi:hypothetical protein
MQSFILELLKYGCNLCGSVPIRYSGSNNLRNGILTSNFVSDIRGCVAAYL